MWRDGKREFSEYGGGWDGSFSGDALARMVGHSQCTYPLAGENWRLITCYDTSSKTYRATAVPDQRPDGPFPYTSILAAQSPESSDQALFLTIFHSLRADTIPELRE